MAVLKDQFFVEIDVELAVFGRHQVAIANGVAVLLQDFARYLSGPERKPSVVAVFDGDIQLVLRHLAPPRDWMAKVYYAGNSANK